MNTNVELLYRPPNRSEHVTVAEALDEIFNRLDQIEDILSQNPPKSPKFTLFSKIFKKWL